MTPLLGVVGAVLVVAAIVDVLWTALWVDGGSGPLSARLSSWIWWMMRRLGGRRSRLMSLGGPMIVAATLVLWVGLLWAGWTLLFAADTDAIVNPQTQQTPSWPGRIYFVAYAMFTMGNGDFSPTSGFWQIATSLTTASGMLFVTMAVSYVLSVLGAVAQKRAFATSVTGLGTNSADLVRQGWDGNDLHRLDLPLHGLASQISLLADQHRAYPILHYYHSEQSRKASGVAVAVLDDALTMIRLAIPQERRPNMAIVESARSSIGEYLSTLRSAFIQPADDAPPAPDLTDLSDAGVTDVDRERFDNDLAQLADRRRLLLGMVLADGWPWQQVRR